MQVTAYVEWYDETSTYGTWERLAEFKYSDEATVYAKAAYAKSGAASFRVVIVDGCNGHAWHSDEARDAKRSFAA